MAHRGAPRRLLAATPVTRPSASVISCSTRVCGSTVAPLARTAAASRAYSTRPEVPRPYVRWPRGAGGATAASDCSLPE